MTIKDIIIALTEADIEPDPVEKYRLLRQAYGYMNTSVLPQVRAEKVQHNLAINNLLPKDS